MFHKKYKKNIKNISLMYCGIKLDKKFKQEYKNYYWLNNRIERDKDNNIKKIDMLLEMDELYFNL